MRVICSEDKCTGCWACYNACPKECISMKVGILGHLFPVIDTKKCINCKLCEKVCPLDKFISHNNEPKAMTLINKDAPSLKKQFKIHKTLKNNSYNNLVVIICYKHIVNYILI